MTYPNWPSVLKPRKVTVQPQFGNMGGGRSISGIDQIVASDAGFWQIVFDEIPVASPAQQLAARAIAAQAGGRLNPINVTTFEQWWMTPSPSKTVAAVASASGAIALGTNVGVVINLTTGTAIQAGMDFSAVGASSTRRYRVSAITNVSGSLYTCNIWPPCREAISNGGSLNFATPGLTVRFATDTEQNTFAEDYAGRTLAKASLVELLP